MNFNLRLLRYKTDLAYKDNANEDCPSFWAYALLYPSCWSPQFWLLPSPQPAPNYIGTHKFLWILHKTNDKVWQVLSMLAPSSTLFFDFGYQTMMRCRFLVLENSHMHVSLSRFPKWSGLPRSEGFSWPGHHQCEGLPPRQRIQFSLLLVDRMNWI